MKKCGLETEVELPCSDYRPRVLIAQSDQDSLELLVENSRVYNKYDVEIAVSGQAVVDMVNEYCFDAIVLGLKFPDITGATLAYLIHRFDPLVSVAFLSNYKSDILISVAQDLGFKFWNKDEKFEDLEKLCKDIYDLALYMPCDAEKRIIKREFMRPEREEYLKYGKLTVPHSIQQVLIERKERKTTK
jgi:CheY-like chemotaxis protein